MATITTIQDCNAVTNEIQQLVDNPSESGLSAAALKQAFDADATNIKSWINDDSNGLLKQINDNFSALNTESGSLGDDIGTLSNLNTTSKTNLVSAINEVNTNMKTNNLLWSGGYFMTADHTIDLSSTPISTQKNGIVLVWSLYKNGAPANENFTFTFVPKKSIELLSGNMVSTTLAGPSVTNFATKIVYVSDTSIAGSGSNVNHGTNSGITYDNRNYVLRYVIGV